MHRLRPVPSSSRDRYAQGIYRSDQDARRELSRKLVAHLGQPAVEVLEKIERVQGNPWVIVGTKPGVRLTDLQQFWQRVRARAGLKDARIQDLRHTFASIAVASGQDLPMISKLLGHSQVQTTAWYTHLAADPIKLAVNHISAEIATLLDGRAA